MGRFDGQEPRVFLCDEIVVRDELGQRWRLLIDISGPQDRLVSQTRLWAQTDTTEETRFAPPIADAQEPRTDEVEPLLWDGDQA